jgi:hypothetical protein
MSDAALPKIKVTDAQNLDESATGTSGVESPSTTTDGGQSARPRSATSSEGMRYIQVIPHTLGDSYGSFLRIIQSKMIK